MPLLDDELTWVNVTVSCPTCGDSKVTIRKIDLIEHQPAWRCPMCNELTGQQTIVQAEA